MTPCLFFKSRLFGGSVSTRLSLAGACLTAWLHKHSVGRGPADETRMHAHTLCEMLMHSPAGSRVAFDPASYIGNVCIHTTLPLSPHTNTHTTLQTLGLRRSCRDSNQRDWRFGCDRAAVEFERDPCRAEKPRGALKATQMGFKFNCAIVKRQKPVHDMPI